MGFGNRLFTWARCRVFAQIHHTKMVAPLWFRPAIGQLWRGGIDYRSYMRQLVLLGLFRKRGEDLGFLKGKLLSLNAVKITEPADLTSRVYEMSDNSKDVEVVFRGWKKFFEPLNGWHDFLLTELRAITRRGYLDMVDSVDKVPVGICVRCGNDFREPKSDGYEPLGPIDKTPLKWYIEMLSLIRKTVGYQVPAFVVSDGTKEQLEKLLCMENVTFVRPGSAISDLLILAKAKVLLTPGASSFAAWASFLGQMPSVSHPGQPLDTVWRIKNEKEQFIGEFAPHTPREIFLQQSSEALKKA